MIAWLREEGDSSIIEGAAVADTLGYVRAHHRHLTPVGSDPKPAQRLSTQVPLADQTAARA
ncbi:MAG: hypothetical protein ACOH1P_00465 [Lysobacter sp.]